LGREGKGSGREEKGGRERRGIKEEREEGSWERCPGFAFEIYGHLIRTRNRRQKKDGIDLRRRFVERVCHVPELQCRRKVRSSSDVGGRLFQPPGANTFTLETH